MSAGKVAAKLHPAVMNVLAPASGTGRFWKKAAKSIRFCRQGCTNRPFFQIVVTHRRHDQHQPVIEQIGTYDPIPNKFNQQMVSLNVERIRHWLGNGAHISRPVAELIGLSGLLPIYPKTYQTAWRNRKRLQEQAEQDKLKVETDEATAAAPAS